MPYGCMLLTCGSPASAVAVSSRQPKKVVRFMTFKAATSGRGPVFRVCQPRPMVAALLRQQAFDHFAAVADFDGAVAGGHQFLVGHDPELVINGRRQILRT